jgi:hypothetical protein
MGNVAQNTPQGGTSTGAAGSTPSTTGGMTSGTAGKTGSMTTSGTAGGGSSMTSGGTAGKPAASGTAGGGAAMMSGGTAGSGGGAAPAAGDSKGFAMCGMPAKEGMCKATAPGIYAQRVELDVWYMDEINTSAPLFDPGRGKLTLYFRTELSNVCEDGSGGKAVNHPCGSVQPPLFIDAVGGVIQINFPDDLWDKPGIPDYISTGSASGFNPGDTLSIVKTTGLFGISLTDPAGAWPTYMQTTTISCADGKMGKDCFPDIDADMNPGVTLNIQTEGMAPNPGYDNPLGPWHYAPAPTSATDAAFAIGAKDVYVGLRVSVGGSGKIGADCKSGTGPGDANDIESRVFDCVMADGMKCQSSGVEFVDQNTPAFHVLKAGEMPPAAWKHARAEADAKLNRAASMGPIASVVRLGDIGQTFACGDVRSAPYPMAQ